MQDINTNFSLRKIYCGNIVQGTEPASKDEFQFSQHIHRECLYVVSGKSRYMLNRTVCELKPGDAVMIDSFFPHSLEYTEADHDLVHLWMWFFEDHPFHCNFIKIYDKDSIKLIRGMLLPMELSRMIQYRWGLLRSFTVQTPQLLNDLMRVPFQMLLDELKLQIDYHIPVMKKNQLSDFLKNYIRNSLGRDCSLKKLSEITGYSVSHLAHSFQQETGSTIGAYLFSVRMEYTKTAMKNGVKQKTIASELGFSSPASFWNWFQKNAKKDDFSVQ